MFATVLTSKWFLTYDCRLTWPTFKAKQQHLNSDPKSDICLFMLMCVHCVCGRCEYFLKGLTSAGTFTLAFCLRFPVMQKHLNDNEHTLIYSWGGLCCVIVWLAGASGNLKCSPRDSKRHYLANDSVKYLIWNTFLHIMMDPKISAAISQGYIFLGSHSDSYRLLKLYEVKKSHLNANYWCFVHLLNSVPSMSILKCVSGLWLSFNSTFHGVLK